MSPPFAKAMPNFKNFTNCPQPYFFMSSGSIDMLQRRSGVPIGVEPRAWLLQSHFFVYTWYNVNDSFLNVFVAFICSCRENRKIFFYLSIDPCSSTWQSF